MKGQNGKGIGIKMNQCLNSKKSILYFNSVDKFCSIRFSKALSELLNKYQTENQTIIFLCIGSDRATGDSLGPIIGYQLSKMNAHNCIIYGTLENPVHAKNLADTIMHIETTHRNSIIVAIDASLGTSSHIGYITLGEGTLKPGAGVEKKLPAVGDIFITGIVNLSGVFDQMLLQSTRLNVVMKMAECISMGIRFSIHNL